MHDKPIPDNILKAFNILKNSEELSLLQTALTKIFIEFDIDYKEFQEDLGKDLINTLFAQTNNKSLIMSKTGLSHRAVAKAINHQGEPNINLKRNLLAQAFSQINSYCQSNNTQGMPKFLFYANMRSYTDGKTSIKVHLEKLFDTGIIREDDAYVYLELEKSMKKRNNDELIAMLSTVISNLVNTVTFNKNQPNNTDKLFQMYLQSSHIPPNLAPRVQQELLVALREFYQQMNSLLSNYETDVELGTYPNIGLSLFQYNNNLTTKE